MLFFYRKAGIFLLIIIVPIFVKNLYCGGASWSISRLILQKISLRRQESRLAARASHSAVSVDFPETTLSGLPCGFAVLIPASKVVLFFSKNLPAVVNRHFLFRTVDGLRGKVAVKPRYGEGM